MTAFMGSIWTVAGGLALGLIGVVYGLFKHQQANAVKATADAQVAQNGAQLAKANEAAAVAETTALVNAQKAEEEAAAVPEANLDAELNAIGALRKE